MKRLLLLQLILTLGFQLGVMPAPTAQAQATPSATVTVSQKILPPDCYDIVNVASSGAADYIAVFNCEYQK